MRMLLYKCWIAVLVLAGTASGQVWYNDRLDRSNMGLWRWCNSTDTVYLCPDSLFYSDNGVHKIRLLNTGRGWFTTKVNRADTADVMSSGGVVGRADSLGSLVSLMRLYFLASGWPVVDSAGARVDSLIRKKYADLTYASQTDSTKDAKRAEVTDTLRGKGHAGYEFSVGDTIKNVASYTLFAPTLPFTPWENTNTRVRIVTPYNVGALAGRGLQIRSLYGGTYASSGLDVITVDSGGNSQDHTVGIQNAVYSKLDGGKTLTSLYGIASQVTNSGPGAVTTAYGLYLYGAGGTCTNKFGIYQAGAADSNYFAGPVSIGQPNPEGAQLKVYGTTNSINLVRTGSTAGIAAFQFTPVTTVGYLYGFGTTYASSGPYWAGSMNLYAGSPGGITLCAAQGLAPIRFYAGGTTLKKTLTSGFGSITRDSMSDNTQIYSPFGQIDTLRAKYDSISSRLAAVHFRSYSATQDSIRRFWAQFGKVDTIQTDSLNARRIIATAGINHADTAWYLVAPCPVDLWANSIKKNDNDTLLRLWDGPLKTASLYAYVVRGKPLQYTDPKLNATASSGADLGPILARLDSTEMKLTRTRRDLAREVKKRKDLETTYGKGK